MKLKLLITVCGGVLIASTPCVFAQTAAGAAAGAAKAGSGGAEAASGVGKYANYDQVAAHQRGGMSFQGKVAVDGGTLPWDPIQVSATCDGKVRYNTQADGKGQFQIQGTKTNSEVAAQPTNSNQLAASQLVGCQVHASLAGYRSSILT